MRGAIKNLINVIKNSAKNKNPLEIIAGFAILALVAYFMMWGASVARTSVVGYDVVARFGSVAGISRGSDVKINGVKVGSVSELKLDSEVFTVDVVMSIGKRYRIPKDSVARITSTGFIGAPFISIEIGTSPERATSAMRLASVPNKSLEEAIGNVIYR
ncbi:MAG: MlaD family protein [Alphaproteobacteria bacterium]|nr:MlaD family protein [Alphaproteobacteria bacterium]